MDDDRTHDGLRDISRDSEDVARYYDDWADTYDRDIALWDYRAPAHVAGLLAGMVGTEAVVLDAGCGTGLSGRAVRDVGFEVVDGIDVSARSVRIAEERGVYRAVQAVDMQAPPFPLPTDGYDALVCVGVLTYLPDTDATLREFARMVRSSGPIIVTQRTDLFDERDVAGCLDALVAAGVLRDVEVSDPEPYLPGNAEFADELLVRTISCRVA